MEATLNVLDKVNMPSDLLGLNKLELEELSSEIRSLIIKKVNTIGGHMGPNLGMVEMTIALHRVFDFSKDKLVFDVSHQCYTHKILTGRKEGFTNPDLYLKYSGYTAPEESEYDIFKVGHTSTSVSLATGLAKARDLKGTKENVVTIIGDGSLSGGEAYEGLNNASTLGSNMIIIVNDNEMSIAPNQGGLYENLRILRESNGQAECNFFKSLGFEYRYLNDGHDFEKLEELFRSVKDINHPIILHIHTLKGKGLEPAVRDKEKFHWVNSGCLDDKSCENVTESYESLTADYILKRYQEDKTIVAITPATPAVSGFTPEFREKMGVNFIDVGIAEEHAVAYASGLAKAGAKPILAIMSSFSQRVYDQLSQDLALNNSPATILIFWAGISGMDATHLTKYDIPLISNIPNIVYLAPTNKEEYIRMLDWSTNQKEHSVVIRVPFIPLNSEGQIDNTDYSKINKFKVVQQGSDVAIIGVGNFFGLAKQVKELVSSELGINSTLINPHFVSGIDEELMESLKSKHKVVITLEDGAIEGGFGEKIASYYGKSNMKVLNFGATKDFTDRADVKSLYEIYHLMPQLILNDLKQVL